MVEPLDLREVKYGDFVTHISRGISDETLLVTTKSSIVLSRVNDLYSLGSSTPNARKGMIYENIAAIASKEEPHIVLCCRKVNHRRVARTELALFKISSSRDVISQSIEETRCTPIEINVAHVLFDGRSGKWLLLSDCGDVATATVNTDDIHVSAVENRLSEMPRNHFTRAWQFDDGNKSIFFLSSEKDGAFHVTAVSIAEDGSISRIAEKFAATFPEKDVKRVSAVFQNIGSKCFLLLSYSDSLVEVWQLQFEGSARIQKELVLSTHIIDGDADQNLTARSIYALSSNLEIYAVVSLTCPQRGFGALRISICDAKYGFIRSAGEIELKNGREYESTSLVLHRPSPSELIVVCEGDSVLAALPAFEYMSFSDVLGIVDHNTRSITILELEERPQSKQKRKSADNSIGFGFSEAKVDLKMKKKGSSLIGQYSVGIEDILGDNGTWDEDVFGRTDIEWFSSASFTSMFFETCISKKLYGAATACAEELSLSFSSLSNPSGIFEVLLQERQFKLILLLLANINIEHALEMAIVVLSSESVLLQGFTRMGELESKHGRYKPSTAEASMNPRSFVVREILGSTHGRINDDVIRKIRNVEPADVVGLVRSLAEIIQSTFGVLTIHINVLGILLDTHFSLLALSKDADVLKVLVDLEKWTRDETRNGSVLNRILALLGAVVEESKIRKARNMKTLIDKDYRIDTIFI